MTGRKTRSDSVAGQKAKAQASKALPDPPEGCEMETKELKMIWKHFVAARAPDAWREFDLILVSKMVRAEVLIRRWNKILESSGPIIENKRGTMVENPILRSIDTVQRQQLAIVRSLSLGISSDSGKGLNKSGSHNDDEKDLEKIKGGKIMSLVAK